MSSMLSMIDPLLNVSKAFVQFLMIIYPSYKSYKALESKRISDAHEMLVFWSMNAFIQSLQVLADELLWKYSSKSLYRSVWIILKLMPILIGPSRLYRYLIKPIYKANETTVDALVNDASTVQNKTVQTLKGMGEETIKVAAATAQLTIIAPMESIGMKVSELKNEIRGSIIGTDNRENNDNENENKNDNERIEKEEEEESMNGRDIVIEREKDDNNNNMQTLNQKINDINKPTDHPHQDHHDHHHHTPFPSSAPSNDIENIASTPRPSSDFEADLNRRIHAHSICPNCERRAHAEYRDLQSKGMAVSSPLLPRHYQTIGEESIDPCTDAAKEMSEQGMLDDEADEFGLKRRRATMNYQYNDSNNDPLSVATPRIPEIQSKLVEAKTMAAIASD